MKLSVVLIGRDNPIYPLLQYIGEHDAFEMMFYQGVTFVQACHVFQYDLLGRAFGISFSSENSREILY